METQHTVSRSKLKRFIDKNTDKYNVLDIIQNKILPPMSSLNNVFCVNGIYSDFETSFYSKVDANAKTIYDILDHKLLPAGDNIVFYGYLLLETGIQFSRTEAMYSAMRDFLKQSLKKEFTLSDFMSQIADDEFIRKNTDRMTTEAIIRILKEKLPSIYNFLISGTFDTSSPDYHDLCKVVEMFQFKRFKFPKPLLSIGDSGIIFIPQKNNEVVIIPISPTDVITITPAERKELTELSYDMVMANMIQQSTRHIILPDISILDYIHDLRERARPSMGDIFEKPKYDLSQLQTASKYQNIDFNTRMDMLILNELSEKKTDIESLEQYSNDPDRFKIELNKIIKTAKNKVMMGDAFTGYLQDEVNKKLK